MTKTIPSPHSVVPLEIRDTQERLYFLIRKRVKWTTFSRQFIDPEELISDVYMRLAVESLPDFGTKEFRIVLRNAVKRIIWDRRRPVRPMLDIDEVDHEDHPYYDTEFFSEEEEFERFFAKFCDSFPEPQRTVFSLSRVIPKEGIAELTGLGRNTVAQLIKSMPEEFKKYFEKFSKSISR